MSTTQSSLSAYGGGGYSTRIYADSGKYRGLVRLCGVMRWAAGLLYAARGDEEAGGGTARATHCAGAYSTAE
jgi:hypothetical protein